MSTYSKLHITNPALTVDEIQNALADSGVFNLDVFDDTTRGPGHFEASFEGFYSRTKLLIEEWSVGGQIIHKFEDEDRGRYSLTPFIDGKEQPDYDSGFIPDNLSALVNAVRASLNTDNGTLPTTSAALIDALEITLAN